DDPAIDVLVLPQAHLDAVPLGKASHHVQPHAAPHGHVQVRRVGETFVRFGDLTVTHADTTVGDLDGKCLPSCDHGTNTDLGLGFGKVRCVVEQLCQQVHQVVHTAAVHTDLWDRAHLHPGVLLDLRDRSTQHVGRGHGPRHGLPQSRTGQHQQILTVATQPR